MNYKELICKKKVSQLDYDDFVWFTDAVKNNQISNRQILEFIKTITDFKLNTNEVYLFAKAMSESGEMLNIGKSVGFCVDKHSVGQISDGMSLILMSALASLDIKFIKSVSPTYDNYGSLYKRLTSFKDFKLCSKKEELIKNINKSSVGLFLSEDKIAPVADTIYKICKDNDVLINSVICATIMANKIAVGSSMVIIDIKSGEGGVWEGDSYVELAGLLKDVGELAGIKTVCIITDLNWPIAASVGINLEVQEIKDTLSSAKQYNGNLLNLAKEMAVCAMLASKKALGRSVAAEMFDKAVESGSMYQKFCQIIDTYGGDVTSVNRSQKLIDTAVSYITADFDGYIYDIKLQQLYNAVNNLIGTGTDFDSSAGLILMCGEGDKVVYGQKLAKVFYSHGNSRFFTNVNQLFDSFKILKQKPTVNNLFYKVVI